MISFSLNTDTRWTPGQIDHRKKLEMGRVREGERMEWEKEREWKEKNQRERKNDGKVRILCRRNDSQPSFFLLICVLVWSTFISFSPSFTLFSPRLLCPHPLSPTLYGPSRAPTYFPTLPLFSFLLSLFNSCLLLKRKNFFSLPGLSKSWPFFSKCESCRSSSLQLFPSPSLLEPMDKQVGSFFSWID